MLRIRVSFIFPVVALLAAVTNAQLTSAAKISCASLIEDSKDASSTVGTCATNAERRSAAGSSVLRPLQAAATVSLGHTLLVLATGTPADNGKALIAAVATASKASAAAPYLVELDAGTYTLPAPASNGAQGGLNLPAYVSLKGSGMLSTLITSPDNGLLYSTSAATGTNASVSDLTVSTAGGYAISAENFSDLLIDHVRANGYVNFSSNSAGAHMLVTSSVLNGPTTLRTTSGHGILSDTEVLSFFQHGLHTGCSCLLLDLRCKSAAVSCGVYLLGAVESIPTTGGNFARRASFTVALAGTLATGVARCDQVRPLDVSARGGRRIESVSDDILAEVLARIATLF